MKPEEQPVSAWDELPDGVAAAVFGLLSNSSASSSRLACRSWCVQVPGGLSILTPTGAAPAQWGRLSAVRKLDLSGCVGWQPSHLKELAAVESVRLGAHTTDEDIRAIRPLAPFLRSFSLDNRGKMAAASSDTRRANGAAVSMTTCRRVTDQGIAALSALPHLRDVNLSGCEELSDEAIRALTASHPQLEALALAYCANVTDFGLSSTTALVQLRTLDIAGCSSVTDCCLEGLPSSLTKLNLARCPGVTDTGIKHLPPHLTSLSLARARQLTDCGMEALGKLSGLSDLNLVGCSGFSGSGVHLLKGLTALRKLNVAACPQISDTSAADLALLTALTHLDMSVLPGITSEAVACLAGLTALEHLSLRRCINVVDISGLERLRHLKSLELGWLDRVSSLSALQGLESLASLDVCGCSGLDDDAVAVLTGMSSLTALSIGGSVVGNSELARGALNWAGMKRLTLVSSFVTDDGLAALAKMSHLSVLNLRCCNWISGEGLGILSSLGSLRIVSLSRCTGLTGEGLSRLSSAAASLTDLDLSQCHQLSDEMLRVVLGDLTLLRRLSLEGCKQISGACLSSAAGGMRSLSLSQTSVGPAGVKALCLGMPSLACLKLSHCHRLQPKAIPYLTLLTSLSTLELVCCTGLARDQVDELVCALPGANIIY